LVESESVLKAIRRGEIDAIVVSGAGEERVFTLEGAEHPYRVLVESMSEGAATLSRDGVILYTNPKLAALLGTTAAALTSTRLVDWAAPPNREQLDVMVDACGSEAVSGELALVASNGALRPVHVSLSPLVLESESFCCAIISDQRFARHHAALEKAAQKTKEANDRLRDADQRKDVFLATLAHELRNPLAPIRAAATFLGMVSNENDDRAKACKIIERQVAHLTRLVDDLLEVSRITLGRLKLQQKRESLTRVIVGVTEVAKSSLNMKQAFSVQLPDDEMPINGDVVRLSQAISNVIENAVKYTPADGRIEVRITREADCGVVRVRDTGIGIRPGAAPRIFEMFAQGERPEGYRHGGLGIGLALTRSIVELHGGTIEASSRGPDQGSEFIMRLPLDKAQLEHAGTEDHRFGEAQPQAILIVDDNVDAAEALRMTLELSGHIAKTVHEGIAALAAFDEFSPDLVLLDIGLPDIDGYEVARRLRARCGASCPMLVALSGWGRDEDKLRASDAGIDAHLTKPVSPDSLNRIVADNAAQRSRWLQTPHAPRAR
jgi:PAS domain S-box-containing protein